MVTFILQLGNYSCCLCDVSENDKMSLIMNLTAMCLHLRARVRVGVCACVHVYVRVCVRMLKSRGKQTTY